MSRRLPIIPTLLVAAAVAVMIALGLWQLQRLEEKEAMLAEFARNSGKPLVIDPAPGSEGDLLYRKVRMACATPHAWVAIAGRNNRDQAGYVHQFTCRDAAPVPAFDGIAFRPALFVVIGWSQGPTPVEFAGGKVEGTLVRAGDGFRVVSGAPLAEGLEPAATPDPNDLPNNHLAYAGQWFFFAASALVIYVLALRKRRWGG